MMTSYGVNTLISDSGVMKYRIVAEKWEVNEIKVPARWIFERGLFMEQYDEQFHAQAFVQADTAYYYTQKKLWHLIGTVRVRTMEGLRFSSEELYWDQNAHELYSNKYSKIVSPERELEGAYFTSDEHMLHYTVHNTKGSFRKSDADKKDDKKNANDTAQQVKREPMNPNRVK